MLAASIYAIGFLQCEQVKELYQTANCCGNPATTEIQTSCDLSNWKTSAFTDKVTGLDKPNIVSFAVNANGTNYLPTTNRNLDLTSAKNMNIFSMDHLPLPGHDPVFTGVVDEDYMYFVHEVDLEWLANNPEGRAFYTELSKTQSLSYLFAGTANLHDTLVQAYSTSGWANIVKMSKTTGKIVMYKPLWDITGYKPNDDGTVPIDPETGARQQVDGIATRGPLYMHDDLLYIGDQGSSDAVICFDKNFDLVWRYSLRSQFITMLNNTVVGMEKWFKEADDSGRPVSVFKDIRDVHTVDHPDDPSKTLTFVATVAWQAGYASYQDGYYQVLDTDQPSLSVMTGYNGASFQDVGGEFKLFDYHNDQGGIFAIEAPKSNPSKQNVQLKWYFNLGPKPYEANEAISVNSWATDDDGLNPEDDFYMLYPLKEGHVFRSLSSATDQQAISAGLEQTFLVDPDVVSDSAMYLYLVQAPTYKMRGRITFSDGDVFSSSSTYKLDITDLEPYLAQIASYDLTVIGVDVGHPTPHADAVIEHLQANKFTENGRVYLNVEGSKLLAQPIQIKLDRTKHADKFKLDATMAVEASYWGVGSYGFLSSDQDSRTLMVAGTNNHGAPFDDERRSRLLAAEMGFKKGSMLYADLDDVHLYDLGANTINNPVGAREMSAYWLALGTRNAPKPPQKYTGTWVDGRPQFEDWPNSEPLTPWKESALARRNLAGSVVHLDMATGRLKFAHKTYKFDRVDHPNSAHWAAVHSRMYNGDVVGSSLVDVNITGTMTRLVVGAIKQFPFLINPSDGQMSCIDSTDPHCNAGIRSNTHKLLYAPYTMSGYTDIFPWRSIAQDGTNMYYRTPIVHMYGAWGAPIPAGMSYGWSASAGHGTLNTETETNVAEVSAMSGGFGGAPGAGAWAGDKTVVMAFDISKCAMAGLSARENGQAFEDGRAQSFEWLTALPTYDALENNGFQVYGDLVVAQNSQPGGRGTINYINKHTGAVVGRVDLPFALKHGGITVDGVTYGGSGGSQKMFTLYGGVRRAGEHTVMITPFGM
jgi:hypothetical protein